MKIDMNAAAISRRLKQASELRRMCLSLARSSACLDAYRRHPANKSVQRTAAALGKCDPR